LQNLSEFPRQGSQLVVRACRGLAGISESSSVLIGAPDWAFTASLKVSRRQGRFREESERDDLGKTRVRLGKRPSSIWGRQGEVSSIWGRQGRFLLSFRFGAASVP